MSQSDSNNHLLMSPARIDRIITRIAYQIHEHTRGSDELVVMGIDERGFYLAQRLAERLSMIYQVGIAAHPVWVKNADKPNAIIDSAEKSKDEIAIADKPMPSVKGKKVVIVDDVMYSGKTMYVALQKITENESPDEITLAALIDRGHRRYPLNLQYVGLYCPTKLQEHVHCNFSQGDSNGVWLFYSSDQE